MLDEFGLHQNYPNPFNPSTNITIDIPSSAYVILEVYSINGQKIITLADEQKQPGIYTYSFNGSRLASGVYFVRMTAGNYIKSMPIVLLK
ncbi:MAG: T9SS type A sorting domain-containing protein [Melioribacteraceae bacterium]